ncbi:hypothetical protein N6L26_07535 [Qipengyuania sp. SS22]|uniref:hypothetical protein n=1 Tax=Qipengyuania sp. SS22 TaxID=2979461 RepID=UPI0021E5FD8F|nr:hypothetical protein [Qipengyuania sp. SS22]UYH53926.1 hypothetical protein N6L26_07535 [Qipengyuania sp. SS22]
MSPKPQSARRWKLALGLIAAALLALVLLFTGSQPWVKETRHASAEQVAVARALANEARKSRASGEPVAIKVDAAELEAISAMVTQGFAPNRFDAEVEDGVLTLTGSRPFLFRWINIRAEASGSSAGIPDFAVRIGAVPLPRWLSEWALARIQQRMADQGETLPSVDTIVRSMTIGNDGLTARVLVPQGSLLAHARATGTPPIDEDAVAAIYCRLARADETQPEPLLARQLGRALAATEPTSEGHSAALVALALFAAGPEAREVAGDRVALGDCSGPPARLTLQGREDWAKHWALSAALETAAGSRISAAIGEWKELADTLAKGPLLAPKDPSGFSFVDLAADRSGIMTAQALLDPARLEDSRARLLRASEAGLLPARVLELSDGLTDAQFARRYGATDDPRFAAKVEQIDAMLRRGGIGE